MDVSTHTKIVENRWFDPSPLPRLIKDKRHIRLSAFTKKLSAKKIDSIFFTTVTDPVTGEPKRVKRDFTQADFLTMKETIEALKQTLKRGFKNKGHAKNIINALIRVFEDPKFKGMESLNTDQVKVLIDSVTALNLPPSTSIVGVSSPDGTIDSKQYKKNKGWCDIWVYNAYLNNPVEGSQSLIYPIKQEDILGELIGIPPYYLKLESLKHMDRWKGIYFPGENIMITSMPDTPTKARDAFGI